MSDNGRFGHIVLRHPATSNGSYGPFAIIIQRGMDIVYINATSTRECTFRAVFAA